MQVSRRESHLATMSDRGRMVGHRARGLGFPLVTLRTFRKLPEWANWGLKRIEWAEARSSQYACCQRLVRSLRSSSDLLDNWEDNQLQPDRF
jgi:hypothetical protein